MPQIQINGELREVSQAEYDALTTNGQASTPAAGSYEQYAAVRAKEQAVNKLADADANFETGTNVSPEFQQELANLRTSADSAAGDNAAAYAERYAQEQQDLYANGETNLAALREELSAPAPTTAPGTVGVDVSRQQGIDGEVIGTLNTASPGPDQAVGSIVSEPVDASPAEVNPTIDPQANLPADIANAPDPTVVAYFQNKAELEAFQKFIAKEEGDRPTYVVNPEERAAFIAGLEANIQREEARLEQKGLLSAVQQAEEQDRIENEAARPPIASLAELYPDDEPTAVSAAEIETAPVEVSAVSDPEVAVAEAAQTSEQVPVAEIETEAATELTEEQTSADAEVSAFEEQQTPEAVPLAEVETEAATDLTEEQTAADPEVPSEPEGVPAAEIDDGGDALVVDDPQAPGEIEPFSSDLVEVEPESVDPETDPEVIEPLAEFVPVSEIETENDTELTTEQEFADPGIAQDDFVLSAADIDNGDDLDQDPGPGYGDVDEPLDLELLESANEVEIDPYEDVLGRDLTAEEIAAEDNPIDYSNEVEVDPYEDVLGRDLTEEEIQAEDNPIDYDTEDEIDPYNAIADRDLTEEEIQAEDNPIDYDTENEIDPFEVDGAGVGLTEEEIQQQDNPIQRQAVQQQATLDRARQQATLQQQRKQANDGDWRVKLRLAPGAQYLYRAPQPGILQPLAITDGVVFPYTPSIQTAYKANYSSYDLTHSNYRGYFYQGSHVEDIQITGKFTAQDSNEANYLLAVIHFFRSITKMFYGNDPQRGAPPPLVFLQGLGEYQFNLAPCVVAQFNYTLPDNVDYIRAGSPNINGANLLQRRNRQDLPTNIFTSALGRIQSVLGAQGIKKGAIPSPPSPPTLGTNRPTYVPTAMDISIVLHPIQSRSQVSKQFSLKQYASGDLLKGGFW